MRNKYVDEKGRILYISHCYRGFATVYRIKKGRNFDAARLEASELPICDSWVQAQEDLDRYAEKKKLQAYCDDKTCKYFYGIIENGSYNSIQCGTRAFLCYTNKEILNNQYQDICHGDHTECRAYCVRILEVLGFEPQSYWHTEDMRKMVREIEAIKSENNLLVYLMQQVM